MKTVVFLSLLSVVFSISTDALSLRGSKLRRFFTRPFLAKADKVAMEEVATDSSLQKFIPKFVRHDWVNAKFTGKLTRVGVGALLLLQTYGLGVFINSPTEQAERLHTALQNHTGEQERELLQNVRLVKDGNNFIIRTVEEETLASNFLTVSAVLQEVEIGIPFIDDVPFVSETWESRLSALAESLVFVDDVYKFFEQKPIFAGQVVAKINPQPVPLQRVVLPSSLTKVENIQAFTYHNLYMRNIDFNLIGSPKNNFSNKDTIIWGNSNETYESGGYFASFVGEDISGNGTTYYHAILVNSTKQGAAAEKKVEPYIRVVRGSSEDK